MTALPENPSALVLFSGGQDSTVCLAWALSRFERVETVGFDYGQRHRSELAARPRILEKLHSDFPQWSRRLGADHLLPIDTLKAIGGSALTDDIKIEMSESGLPTSFVPGRNLMFLTAAAALGYRRGIAQLVGGMCETDFSGYPDCRDETVQATAKALSLGLAKDVRVHTPLMWIDKAATWRLAEELGGRTLVDLIVEETVTCYEGDRGHRRDWGYGCGQCPACELRAAGYEKYRSAGQASVPSPTRPSR
jgi:7-cyano-7-deazaguanine synthase